MRVGSTPLATPAIIGLKKRPPKAAGACRGILYKAKLDFVRYFQGLSGQKAHPQVGSRMLHKDVAEQFVLRI